MRVANPVTTHKQKQSTEEAEITPHSGAFSAHKASPRAPQQQHDRIAGFPHNRGLATFLKLGKTLETCLTRVGGHPKPDMGGPHHG